jgi:hypothetical protein
MLDFILSGVIGDLKLGTTRAEVRDKLGIPPTWSGKPPTFGPSVSHPEQADVWLYYNDAAGIKFDECDLSVQISIFLDLVNNAEHPFKTWPIGPGAKMVQLRQYLEQNKVPFCQELDPNELQYILANSRCLALGAPYLNGRLLELDEQPLQMISTVSDLRYFGPHIKRV